MFRIFTDTPANLPRSFVLEHDIFVIPLIYLVDGVEHTETIDNPTFDAAAYYQMQRDGKVFTTSQIPPQHFQDAFSPILEQGEDILFISISSGISGSYQSAQIAVAELAEKYPQRKIRTVNSLAASLGEGLFVMKAVEMRARGMTLDDTAEALLALRPHLCQLLLVDDLMYLRRTGRVSGASAVVGTLLGVKPLLKGNEEGQLVIAEKIRGRGRSIQAMAERYRLYVKDAQEQTVCIAHADCQADAEKLAALIRSICPPKDILTVCYEPVTGSHTGPDALALFFFGESDVRSK